MIAPPVIERVSFRLATDADKHLPTFDNTKLQALNTCPTWGVMRYQMHRNMPGMTGRAMPLECGSAMHEVFAWVRLCTLEKQRHDASDGEHGDYAVADLIRHHGSRLFGRDRYFQILQEIGPEPDYEQRCKRGAIAVLETSGFYDDPTDKRRTLQNMIEASLAYIDKWRWSEKVWMRDEADPLSDVGIEIPFDVVVALDTDEKQDGRGGKKYTHTRLRYTGKIDGIHWHRDKLTLQENKTASRLNEAWANSFYMSSQVTGYCIAATVFSGGQVRNADVLGVSIPLPKNYDYGGLVTQSVSRDDHHFQSWTRWLLHTVQLYEQYKDNPYDAPRYTHSCNRYFRSCSLLPFCDSSREDQELMVKDMVTEEWSPLSEKAGD